MYLCYAFVAHVFIYIDSVKIEIVPIAQTYKLHIISYLVMRISMGFGRLLIKGGLVPVIK